MKIEEVCKLAHELFIKHGLIYSKGILRYGYNIDWKLEFTDDLTYTGQVVYNTYTINLSISYMSIMDEVDVRNVILHEIAHAIVGPYCLSHGDKWKNKCIEIGGDGEPFCFINKFFEKYNL